MNLRKDRSGAFDVFITALIVLVVVLVVVVYQAWMLGLEAAPIPAPEVVERTDTIEFDYIGNFEDGRVFGTSVKSVADDDVSYPKSLSYTYPADGTFNPVLSTIGGGFVEPGAAPFFGMENKGKALESEILGMRVGETRVVALQPEEAYGMTNVSLLETRTLVETVPQYEEMSTITYSQRFSEEGPPFEGKSLKDPFWGWDVYVYYLNRTNDLVIIRHNPTPGMVVSPYSQWNTLVEDVDSAANEGLGEIRVRHQLSPEDADRVLGQSIHEKFIVTSVDPEAGTFIADFNDERAGKVLYLRITLLSISKI
ncbi:MAG: FKBP-type peptidyl-prolyl cis-trans isomerase [Candidatus Thermoplasmatota archaeon]|nr:FKBP-type peptidyl-prolyl cis-trans isomerase [Candidatus Thermoplasmatota archaeon]